jgi:hypothetical protein
MIDIYHHPKQLEIIKLKLEIDSERERKSKPKHIIMMRVMRQLASKFTSISRGRGAAHMMPSTKQSVGGRKCDRQLVLFGQSVHFEETSSEPLPDLSTRLKNILNRRGFRSPTNLFTRIQRYSKN